MVAKEKYRMLRVGEVVLPTDELFVGCPINKWVCGSLNCGKKLPAKYVGAYRRLNIIVGAPKGRDAMKVKDVRKVAEMWERNNSDLLSKSRGSRREYYRGFMVACQAFQDLIDGKRDNPLVK